METSKWTAWIELAAATSVLIGLLFVAMEIRQNNEHAKADSVRDLFQMWGDIYQFEYENSIAVLVKKSIEEPEKLTDVEFLQLGNYLDLVMNAYVAQAVMQQEARLVVGDIADEAPIVARLWFASEASRVWLRDNEGWIRSYAPSFYSALTADIERNPVAAKMPQLERFRDSQ